MRRGRDVREGLQRMAIKTLWYLSLADGHYPWCEDGLYPVDFDRYRQLAQAIEDGGFHGAMVATWPNDPFVSAAMAASCTRRMKFLVAVYSRMTPPKLLAQQALTFDALAGGRLLLNLINGRDNIMRSYGITTSHADRYRLGVDYWRKFELSYRQGSTSHFPNTPLRIAAQQPMGVERWGTGDSPAGVAHCAEVVDVYLTMMREQAVVTQRFATANAEAAAHGRRFSGLGALASVVVRPAESTALEDFYRLFVDTGVDTLREKLNEAIVRCSAGRLDFNTFQAPDARRQGWLDSLRRGQLPTLAALRLDDHLYAGMTAWSSLDVFGSGSSAAYLVGNADGITSTVRRYHDQAGLSALILSGWPLMQEAQATARWLVPRLAEIE